MTRKKQVYYEYFRIMEKKFREVLKYFCADLTATQLAHLTPLTINTINRISHLLRQRMLELSKLQSSPLVGQSLVGQIEVDESYFGAWHTGSGC